MAAEILLGKNLKAYWGTTQDANTLIDCAQRLRFRIDGQVKPISCFGDVLERVIDTVTRIEFELDFVGTAPFAVGDKVYVKIKKRILVGSNWEESDLFVLPKSIVANIEYNATVTDELRGTAVLQPAFE
jgi:hypothetical protein